MTALYPWLMFFHIVGVAVFLFAHGISGGASLLLRGPVSPETRRLLKLSQTASFASNPGLLLILVTGIWMGFAGHWWGRGWIWASILVLVLVLVAMGLIARPYYMARDAAKDGEAAVAQRLGRARPVEAFWIGGVGLLVLFFLMVFKPF